MRMPLQAGAILSRIRHSAGAFSVVLGPIYAANFGRHRTPGASGAIEAAPEQPDCLGRVFGLQQPVGLGLKPFGLVVGPRCRRSPRRSGTPMTPRPAVVQRGIGTRCGSPMRKAQDAAADYQPAAAGGAVVDGRLRPAVRGRCVRRHGLRRSRARAAASVE